VIGPTGKVKGEVYCKNSEVSGAVEGRICVSQLLTLKSDSKITGDIVTFKLSIEPGAKFTGNCKMSESENNEGTTFAKTKEPEKTSGQLGK
jgi:cytoskeletal protein CcmA (bactofilin family)